MGLNFGCRITDLTSAGGSDKALRSDTSGNDKLTHHDSYKSRYMYLQIIISGIASDGYHSINDFASLHSQQVEV